VSPRCDDPIDAIYRLSRAHSLVESIGDDLAQLHAVYLSMSQAGDENRRALAPLIEGLQAGTIAAVLRSLEARRRSLFAITFPQEQPR
jgi:hypothetical protein